MGGRFASRRFEQIIFIDNYLKMQLSITVLISLAVNTVQVQSSFRKDFRNNILAYQVKSWKQKLETRKARGPKSCETLEQLKDYEEFEIRQSTEFQCPEDHLNINFDKHKTSIETKDEALKEETSSHVIHVYDGEILKEVVDCKKGEKRRRWMFDSVEDIEDDDIDRTGYGYLETITFDDENSTIRMVGIDNMFFTYLKKKKGNTYFDISLKEMKFKENFLVPIYEVSNDTNVAELDEDDLPKGDMSWYRDAKYILQNKYYQHLNKKKRLPSKDKRDFVPNIEMFYGEKKYINEKIVPNIPENLKLNCTGISHLKFDYSFDRTAFVAFFGSGNHMMRYCTHDKSI